MNARYTNIDETQGYWYQNEINTEELAWFSTTNLEYEIYDTRIEDASWLSCKFVMNNGTVIVRENICHENSLLG